MNPVVPFLGLFFKSLTKKAMDPVRLKRTDLVTRPL